MAVFVDGTGQLQVAESGFELRVKVRKGLRIIPHVRAGTMAAASIGETPCPTPKSAIFQTQYGGRLEDGQIGGDGIQHVRRQSGGKQGFLKCNRACSQRGVIDRKSVV